MKRQKGGQILITIIYRLVIKLLTERFSAKCNNSSSLGPPNNSFNDLRVSLYSRKSWKTLAVFNSNNSNSYRKFHLPIPRDFQSPNQQCLAEFQHRSSTCLTRVLPRISKVSSKISALLKDKFVEWLAAQVKAWLSNCWRTTKMMVLFSHTALVRIPEESHLSASVCQ